MKEVVQEDPLGCGVACVASILEVSYQEALGLFKNGMNRARTEGFYCPDIIQALGNAGLEYKFKRVVDKSEEIIPENTIVYTKKSLRHPAGHFLAKSNEGWMDPWINFPRFPRQAGFREQLPGIPQYLIFPTRG